MFILSNENSIAQKLLHELRDKNIQKDRERFRNNLKKIGMLLAFNLSKSLEYKGIEVETVLGVKSTMKLKNQTVIIGVLRAGLPLQDGVLELFTEADVGFLGSYRHHQGGVEFEIKTDYIGLGEINNKDVILVDTMLATGASIVASVEIILKMGRPKSIHVVSAIASKNGIEAVKNKFPSAQLWIGDVDELLNAKYYIVPGLGDAGDLAFGLKN